MQKEEYTVKDDCIFCKIANGEIPSKTLFDNDVLRIILDLGPATRGHALVIPKMHFDDAYQLPMEIALEVTRQAKTMMSAMTDALKCDGFNFVQNNGEAAGQTVPHFHLHMIPRYKNDGQSIGWKPGEPTQEELEEVRKAIEDYLDV